MRKSEIIFTSNFRRIYCNVRAIIGGKWVEKWRLSSRLSRHGAVTVLATFSLNFTNYLKVPALIVAHSVIVRIFFVWLNSIDILRGAGGGAGRRRGTGF